jgi:hypothetical protein
MVFVGMCVICVLYCLLEEWALSYEGTCIKDAIHHCEPLYSRSIPIATSNAVLHHICASLSLLLPLFKLVYNVRLHTPHLLFNLPQAALHISKVLLRNLLRSPSLSSACHVYANDVFDSDIVHNGPVFRNVVFQHVDFTVEQVATCCAVGDHDGGAGLVVKIRDLDVAVADLVVVRGQHMPECCGEEVCVRGYVGLGVCFAG